MEGSKSAGDPNPLAFLDEGSKSAGIQIRAYTCIRTARARALLPARCDNLKPARTCVRLTSLTARTVKTRESVGLVSLAACMQRSIAETTFPSSDLGRV